MNHFSLILFNNKKKTDQFNVKLIEINSFLKMSKMIS